MTTPTPVKGEVQTPSYSADQQRVADWIVQQSKETLGGGDDPIGFVLTSYEYTKRENAQFVEDRKMLMEAGEHMAIEWRLHGSLTDSCRVMERLLIALKSRP